MSLRPRRRDVYAEDFDALCARLAETTHDFRPDLVVGIETGGAHVARAMLPHLGNPASVMVSEQRPATKLKSRLRLGAVVSRLPRSAADTLRWLEVEMRELSLRRRSPLARSASAGPEDHPELRAAAARARRILVVDDTVDSGRTLLAVTGATRVAQPDAEIRTAVLASTWRRPPVRPDYCLLERTLLRLPWSFDAPTPA